MKSEISIENRKAMSIPQKGAVFNSAILLESQCNKEPNDIVSYHFLFKRTAKRPDLLTVLNNFSKGTRINLEDGDYLIKSHDYTILRQVFDMARDGGDDWVEDRFYKGKKIE